MHRTGNSPGTTYIKLILVTFFWGATFVAAKWTVREAPPFIVATTRYAISTVALFSVLAWMAWGKRRHGHFPFPRGVGQWLNLFSLGLTGIFLYNVFFFTGIQWTTATNASLILAATPIQTVVLSSLLLKERIQPSQVAGFLLSFLGVAAVISKGSLEVILHTSFNPGDVLMLGTSLSFAIFSVRGRTVLEDFSPLSATAYASLFGVLMFLLLIFLNGPQPPAPPRFSFYGWLAILQLSFLSTVVGMVWWYEGIKKIGAGRSAMFFNLVTVFAILLAALLLGERLQWPQLLGAALVIGGVYLGTAGGRPIPSCKMAEAEEAGIDP
ncbi:DMT family transporter [Candidatus Deferrimicrobium sp.]|uniref:DMT family transporter n=1 Tax=Candidatus Deferrimicrobium sp. TaxID=3060586 RepID=UPI003C4CEE91